MNEQICFLSCFLTLMLLTVAKDTGFVLNSFVTLHKKGFLRFVADGMLQILFKC